MHFDRLGSGRDARRAFAFLIATTCLISTAAASTVTVTDNVTAPQQDLFGVTTNPLDLRDIRVFGGGEAALNTTVNFSSGTFQSNAEFTTQTTFADSVSLADASTVSISSNLISAAVDWTTRLGAGAKVNFNSTIDAIQSVVPLDLLNVLPTDGAFLQIDKSNTFTDVGAASFSGSARDDAYGRSANSDGLFTGGRALGEVSIDFTQETTLKVLGIYALLTLEHESGDVIRTVVNYEDGLNFDFDLAKTGVWKVTLSDALFLADTTTDLGYGVSAEAGAQQYYIPFTSACGDITTEADNTNFCANEQYFSFESPSINFFEEGGPFLPDGIFSVLLVQPLEFLKLGGLDNPVYSRGGSNFLGEITVYDNDVSDVPLPAAALVMLMGLGGMSLVRRRA